MISDYDYLYNLFSFRKVRVMGSGAGPRRWLPALQLRAKITLGILLPLSLILGIFTLIETNRHSTLVLDNLTLLASHSAQVIENNLRHQMLKSDFVELQALLDTMGSQEEFRLIYLLDNSGEVIFSPNQEGVGKRMDNQQPDCLECHRLDPVNRPRSVVVNTSNGQRVFRSMNPIENSPECAACHDSGEKLIGLLLTDIPLAPIEAPLKAHLNESILWWAGTILMVGLVVNLVINKLVLRPLDSLSADIASFGQGRLPAPVFESETDEIGRLAEGFNEMAILVEARRSENQLLSENLQRQSTQRGDLLKRLITAQEDERKRVARELHDDLGQALGGLAFKTGAVSGLVETDINRAHEELNHIRDLIQETTDHMYDMILALRPSVLDDLGLAPALRAHASRLLEGTGTSFSLQTHGTPTRLSSEVETALYRTFQEALNNIVRHSSADRVEVNLFYKEGSFEGEIADNGHGFDLESVKKNGCEPRGLGLLGMQERISLIGGRLEILSVPEEGTWIMISIPFLEDGCG
jgi:signal transduction histidine kinase